MVTIFDESAGLELQTEASRTLAPLLDISDVCSCRNTNRFIASSRFNHLRNCLSPINQTGRLNFVQMRHMCQISHYNLSPRLIWRPPQSTKCFVFHIFSAKKKNRKSFLLSVKGWFSLVCDERNFHIREPQNFFCSDRANTEATFFTISAQMCLSVASKLENERHSAKQPSFAD